jgi:hypothetical protein
LLAGQDTLPVHAHVLAAAAHEPIPAGAAVLPTALNEFIADVQ